MTGGGRRVVALVVVLACCCAAPVARAAWDCGAPGQPACPAARLAVSSPLRPLPGPVAGQPLFARVRGHLPVGFNESSVGLGAARPAQAAAFGAGLGSSLVRVALNWAFTQARADGPYDWRAWDARYRAYVARGIRPIWAIQASPRWAVDPGAAQEACPLRPGRGLQAGQECLVGPDAQHVGDYAAFAAAVARRYPLSAAVEIWNEPNLAYYWRDPDPGAYGLLARNAIAAVRRADPGMRMLVGALAMPLEPFAAALAHDGTVAAADGLSFHPYPQRPDAGPFKDALAQARPLRTRLVADELGASTADRAGRFAFSETQQRDVVVSSYLTLDRTDDVDAVVFHTDADGPGGFGFVTPTPAASGGFAPRPVYCALARLLRATGLCGLPAP